MLQSQHLVCYLYNEMQQFFKCHILSPFGTGGGYLQIDSLHLKLNRIWYVSFVICCYSWSFSTTFEQTCSAWFSFGLGFMCHHSTNQSQPLEKWKWEEGNAVWTRHRCKNTLLPPPSSWNLHCCIKKICFEKWFSSSQGHCYCTDFPKSWGLEWGLV